MKANRAPQPEAFTSSRGRTSFQTGSTGCTLPAFDDRWRDRHQIQADRCISPASVSKTRLSRSVRLTSHGEPAIQYGTSAGQSRRPSAHTGQFSLLLCPVDRPTETRASAPPARRTAVTSRWASTASPDEQEVTARPSGCRRRLPRSQRRNGL